MYVYNACRNHGGVTANTTGSAIFGRFTRIHTHNTCRNYGGRDCKYGWQCYFQPLSTCSERDVWEPYTVPVRLDHWWVVAISSDRSLVIVAVVILVVVVI